MRGDKAAPACAPGSNTQRCPSELDSKAARVGKGKAAGLAAPAALLFVCRALRTSGIGAAVYRATLRPPSRKGARGAPEGHSSSPPLLPKGMSKTLRQISERANRIAPARASPFCSVQNNRRKTQFQFRAVELDSSARRERRPGDLSLLRWRWNRSMAFGVARRLLEHDVDRIGYESRRRILPERVVRLRA